MPDQKAAPCSGCGSIYMRNRRARTTLCPTCCESARVAKIRATKQARKPLSLHPGPRCSVTWLACRLCDRWHTRENPATVQATIRSGITIKVTFCSATCRTLYRPIVTARHQCPDCGETRIEEVRPGKGRIKLCAPCGRRRKGTSRNGWRRRAKAAGTYRQEDNHRARARYYGVAYEPISKREIYERDGWMCGLCHQPVDPALTFPDPMSASLDHIVPMARGGPHLRHNVQCSHFICNSRKGAGAAPTRGTLDLWG